MELLSRAPVAACLALFAPLTAAAIQATNAPVAPEAVYVARRGAGGGLSVIDLNGFGGGTGNPAYDPTYTSFSEGNSNYPNNPNVRLQGLLLIPPLLPGLSTLTGGSAGVFTLTENSALENVLVGAPLVVSIGDMMLGHALDASMNGGVGPDGCLAGSGNLCASSTLKSVEIAVAPDGSLRPPEPGLPPVHVVPGGANPVSWAPHPNPPPIVSPPLCFDPLIEVQEQTASGSALAPPLGPGLTNLLVPGDAFGDPLNGVPPTGLLGTVQRSFFVGPSLPQASIAVCQPFQIRQRIGHYLYVTDPAAGEVVVLDSNSMAVLARISVEDARELAMGPNLDLLAVTQRSLDQVSFIDIDPVSGTFHRVVAVTSVGGAPTGIAWDPGNEDVLVCNEGSSTVSILSASTLQVRKTVSRGLDRPFAIAVTQRQDGFGHGRNVYFAYVLDRAGRVSLFESGPSGVNGWGFDELIGRTSFVFPHATAIQPDPSSLSSAVWIAHQQQLAPNGTPTGLGGGAVSRLVLDSSLPGMLPLLPGEMPGLRGLSFRVARSVGSDQLTGFPRDLAFDNLFNLGALPNFATPFSGGTPALLNGKSQVRNLVGHGIAPTNLPTYLFVPVHGGSAGMGAVDVIDLATGLRIDTNAHQAGVQSIPADGAMLVMDYFRQ